MFRHYLFFVFLLCSCSLFAELSERQYTFRSLDNSKGLSNNSVNAILQDRLGFMWFGTKDGLDRYDGASFLSFTKEDGTLGNNYITALYEDKNGEIWIGTDIGLYVYSPLTESIRRFYQKSDQNTTIDNAINSITGDKAGNVWISVQAQGIFCYRFSEQRLLHKQNDGSGKIVFRGLERICFDSENVCWIDLHDGNLYSSTDGLNTLTPFSFRDGQNTHRWGYSSKMIAGPYNCLYIGTVDGLVEVNLSTKTVRDLLQKDVSGDNIFVREITFCSDNELWVGTESGVYVNDLSTHEWFHIQSRIGDPYAISDNAVYAICRDREGGVWVGSYFGGVNYYPRQYTYFDKYYPRTDSDEMGRRVREFCAGTDGTIWFGTEDKGLFNFDPKTKRIEAFKSADIYHNVHGLCLDGNYLWVGNFSGGVHRIDLRTRAVKNYGGYDIFSICRTETGEVYLGTIDGLMRYNAEADVFERMPYLSGVFIYHVKEDWQGDLWISTCVDGLYKWCVRTGEWTHYMFDAANPKSLPSNRILSVYEDSHRQIWVMTQGGGFCRFEPSDNTFVRYDSSMGLPSNVMYRMEEDRKGKFWITTNKGLVHFDPKTNDFKVYTTGNGLLSDQFNYQSGFQDENGQIYFGSINGFVTFNPDYFVSNDIFPPVVITDFMLFNKKVVVGAEHSPLKQSITLSDYVELNARQNSFSFRVAALSYQASDMNTLMYKLEGYDSEWYVAGRSPITYSNLPYGTYTLMVKGANSDGVWNPNPKTLQIRILPPFYLSVWAYIVYALLLVGLLMGMIVYWRRRTASRQRHEMEKFEQEKEREVYISKIDFFTNVAHEIRTPLTLIKTPLESILNDRELPESVKTELELMDQNAERLLNLTNQLLDFRKTENKGFKLHPVECDLNSLLSSVYERFTVMAKQKGVRFSLELPQEPVSVSVDKEAMTKIISNLLTNALKYTDTYATLRLLTDERKENFMIETENDGQIVPLAMRENIFRPFVQYRDGKVVTPGTGIGLALARSLAELHHGALAMDQKEDCNRFILTIPIVHMSEPLPAEKTDEVKEQKPKAVISESMEQEEGRKERYSILIVEDNKDMLSFVTRQLSTLYNVLTAGNGLKALEVLEQNEVDLVISDVMMPEMDGMELCRRLKSDLDYSHIPVILLTAKTALESKIEGLELGADAYIEKPFSVEYLRVNVANLLSNRERLRRRFIESPFVKADTMALTKADEQFIRKLNEYVSKHLDQPDLVIDDIADAMNMGRSNFYRKLKGVLDMSPNEYLRLERLKRAAQLLKEGEYGIVEISYMVGFSSPSYFSNCFKKQFGVLPKDFVQ